MLSILAGVTYLLWLSAGTFLPGSPFEWLAFAALALTFLHWVFEKARWHMLPAYLFCFGLALSYPWCREQDFRIRLTYLVVIWAAALLLAGSSCVLAGILFPVFSFARTSGTFRVGVESVCLIDSARTDPYAPSPRKRELMIQIWYPAAASARGRVARYRDGFVDGWRDAHVGLAKTNSLRGAPFASSTEAFPVVLFSGPNNRFQNTFQTEELASHGFVVLAVDHPYAAEFVRFANGRVIRRRKLNVFLDFETDESLRNSTAEVEADLQVRAADVEFVLAALEQAPGKFFEGKLDWSRVGILGHSFGGAVAAEVCRRNPRLRAGINMDGWLFGESKSAGIAQPFFFMLDATRRPDDEEVRASDGQIGRQMARSISGYDDIERSLAAHGGYVLQAAGLEHMNYTDYPLFSRLKAWTGAGSIDARAAHRLINRFTVAFFRTHLMGGSGQELLQMGRNLEAATFRYRTSLLQNEMAARS